MSSIHPTAIVSASAEIADDVEIRPYAVIGAARIGSGCIVHPHVVIADGVVLGAKVEVFPGAFIGKEPKGAGATSRQPTFARSVHVDDNCSVGPNCVIYYDVVVGPNTLLGDGASIREQCRIGARCIISRYVTINYNARIGNDVKVMDLTHITGNMIIEDDAFISTMVGTTNDNVIRQGYGDHVVGPTIGKGAVIGAGSTLLPAVVIGAGATVGAGSVVTKFVGDGTTVMGPAARLRTT
ncbi:MAG TPA: DapH/DapD/GlmU-related protein [Sphingomonadaceae bacterium]|nr:DapH/DapD/GlmU-related protein [Sphingomonadaceae bacterium]